VGSGETGVIECSGGSPRSRGRERRKCKSPKGSDRRCDRQKAQPDEGLGV